MEFTCRILHPIYDPSNDEVDVFVALDAVQMEYHVTLITYQRAQEVFMENPFSIFSNTLFVQSLTEASIHQALKYVIEEGLYLSVFYPINEQARIALFRKFAEEKKVDH